MELEHLLNVIGYGGYVVGGAIALFGRYRDQNMKQATALISTLEKRVESLSSELEDLKKQEASRQREMAQLQERNKFLEDLFLKRSDGDKEYRLQTMEAIKQIGAMYKHLMNTQGGK